MKTTVKGIMVGLVMVVMVVTMAPQMAWACLELICLPTRDGSPAYFEAFNGTDPLFAGHWDKVPKGRLIVDGSGNIFLADGTNHPPNVRSLPDPLPPGTVQYDSAGHPMCVKTTKGWVNVLDENAPGFWQNIKSKPAGTLVADRRGNAFVWDGTNLKPYDPSAPYGNPSGTPSWLIGPHKRPWPKPVRVLPRNLNLAALSSVQPNAKLNAPVRPAPPGPEMPLGTVRWPNGNTGSPEVYVGRGIWQKAVCMDPDGGVYKGTLPNTLVVIPGGKLGIWDGTKVQENGPVSAWVNGHFVLLHEKLVNGRLVELPYYDPLRRSADRSGKSLRAGAKLNLVAFANNSMKSLIDRNRVILLNASQKQPGQSNVKSNSTNQVQIAATVSGSGRIAPAFAGRPASTLMVRARLMGRGGR